MATLFSDIINQSFEDLGVIRPGETITGSLQASSFLALQQRWAMNCQEKTFTSAWYHQVFTLTAGVVAYTVGTGGTLTATADPIEIVSWRSISGAFENSGDVIGFEELQEKAKNPVGQSSVLAQAVASDGAVPSKNIQVFPKPAASPGTLTLDYYGLMQQPATVGDTVTLDLAYQDFMHWDLAMALYPRYARTGAQSLAALNANRQGALTVITALNARILGLQQGQPAAPPQGA